MLQTWLEYGIYTSLSISNHIYRYGKENSCPYPQPTQIQVDSDIFIIFLHPYGHFSPQALASQFAY